MRKSLLSLIVILFSTALLYASPTDAQIETVIKESFNPYLKELEQFVNIETATGNKAGSKKLAEIIDKRMKGLGATTEQIDEKGDLAGTHVIARFKGDGKGKFLIMVHFDTVPDTKNGTYLFRYDSKTGYGYGPGAADSKASVVQVIHLMESFNKLNYKPFEEIIVHFDPVEEAGTDFEEELAIKLAQQVDYVLVTDTGRPNFGIVIKRKTTGSYDINVKGIGGHAGNSPQAGANALMEMGYILTKLDALNSPMPGGKNHNPADYTTEAFAKKGVMDTGQFIPANYINAAVISTTNTKGNVIPDNVQLKINVRCYDKSEHERIEKAIYDLAKNPTVPGTVVTVSGSMSFPSFEVTPEAAKMITLYKKLAKEKAGKTVTEWTAGGVTLANITAQYAPTIDCVGVDADPLTEHTDHEYVDLNSYIPRNITMMHFIAQLGE